MATEVFRSTPEPEKQLAHYSLLDALLAAARAASAGACV